MADRGRSQSLPVPEIGDVMQDPGASQSLKTVLAAWAGRDVVDAANDAEALYRLFKVRADAVLGRST